MTHKFPVGSTIVRVKELGPWAMPSAIINGHSRDCYYFVPSEKYGRYASKEWVEDLYELEKPKCIPNNPQVSGWHWIRNNNPGGVVSNPFPKYWDAENQHWRSPNRKGSPELFYNSGNRYDKPCEY